MKEKHTFSVDEIINASKAPSNEGTSVLVDGRWVVAKPLSYEPIPWRIRRWLRWVVTLVRGSSRGEE